MGNQYCTLSSVPIDSQGEERLTMAVTLNSSAEDAVCMWGYSQGTMPTSVTTVRGLGGAEASLDLLSVRI